MPLLVHPKPGKTCSRFKDAHGLECSVGLGLGIPEVESNALCPEARLVSGGGGGLSLASSLMALYWKDVTGGNFRKRCFDSQV